jgi:radical SAM superfamily enzyme YgiQ (UPF0313 family)
VEVVFINSINFSKTNEIPQLGLLSLLNIVGPHINAEIVDFDRMNTLNEISYENDINENILKMTSFLLAKNAKIYGFYTISNSYPITILLAQNIKKSQPDSIILFGGPQATLTAKLSMIYFPFIDVIGLGEAEKYIFSLIDSLLHNKDLNKVDGIMYRGKGHIIETQPPELLTIEELNNINISNLLNGSKNMSNNGVAHIEAGRGCPFSCTFCSTSLFWKRKFRVKSPDILIKEIEILHTQLGFTHFDLMHDIFTMNRNHLETFCRQLVDKKFPITWGCSSRIDNLTYESIDSMKLSGCRTVFVGLETGSARMQKNINKNIDIESALKKIIYISRLGIEITVSIIFGFADENNADFLETMSVIDRLFINGIRRVQLHKFMPLPNTIELTKIQDKMYFDINDIDFSIFTKNVYPDSLISLIKEYPDVFSQFYTFDSMVRKNYRRMDFMVNFLASIFIVTPLTIKL